MPDRLGLGRPDEFVPDWGVPPNWKSNTVSGWTPPFAYTRELTGVHLGAAAAESAWVVAQVEVVAQQRGSGRLTVEIAGPDGTVAARHEADITISPGRAVHRVSLRLSAPALWWPIGFGDRAFHHARFDLQASERGSGKAHEAAAHQCFAVRTVEIQCKKDSVGESFVPVVNGISVFCRGANWIPVSMLPGMADEGDYARLLGAAAAGGMNMLRVWGGGIYERPVFYDLCDRLGILVWQDFMFACAAYPTYREFLEEVEAEAEYQVKRLRNHPSVALWCGNNENEWLHQTGGLRKGQEKRIIGEQIWSTLLRDIVEEFDPSRAYHQSSPFGHNRADANDQETGDRHHWDTWGGWAPPEAYLRDNGRFISEFGFQSFPCRESVALFAPEATSIDSSNLAHHEFDPSGIDKIVRYGFRFYGFPRTLDEWIDLSQRMQADLVGRAVEHWRRRKFDTAGALVWQLNDSFPAASWSLIDHYGRPKRVFEASRRFFAPLLLTVVPLRDGKDVWAFPALDPSAGFRSVPEFAADCIDATLATVHYHDELSAVLVNDAPFPVVGTVRFTVVSQGAVRGAGEAAVRAGANAKSTEIRLNLETLEIGDYSKAMVRCQFEPDADTAKRLSEFERNWDDGTKAAIGIYGPVYAAAAPTPRFADGLCAETLLVEPKRFHWWDGLTVAGADRPVWFER